MPCYFTYPHVHPDWYLRHERAFLERRLAVLAWLHSYICYNLQNLPKVETSFSSWSKRLSTMRFMSGNDPFRRPSLRAPRACAPPATPTHVRRPRRAMLWPPHPSKRDLVLQLTSPPLQLLAGSQGGWPLSLEEPQVASQPASQPGGFYTTVTCNNPLYVVPPLFTCRYWQSCGGASGNRRSCSCHL